MTATMKGRNPPPRSPAQTRDTHIRITPEVVDFRECAKVALSGWREQQIRYAHEKMIRERKGLPAPVRHPVRLGDRP
jgi:hypothetical protein